MKIDTISIQGSAEWNEDALVINESIRMYGVLDGATSLHPYRGPNQETAGYLASSCLKHYFEDLSAGETAGVSLKDLVVRANALLRDNMIEAGVNVTDKTALWTSALALIRIHDHNVDFAQAGDCMIAAVYADGAVRVVSRDHVAHIDLEQKRILQQAILSGITDREGLRGLVKPIILNNKYRMNSPGGYSVVSGEPELAEFIEYGTFNRISLKGILLITDGLFLPAELGSGGTSTGINTGSSPGGIEAVVKKVMDESLSWYANWLISLENEDYQCVKYPRFKVSDDKTAVWIQFD